MSSNFTGKDFNYVNAFYKDAMMGVKVQTWDQKLAKL